MEAHSTFDILKLVSEETGYPLEKITAATLVEDLGLDSLGFTALMVDLDVPRDKFGIIVTVGDIYKYRAN